MDKCAAMFIELLPFPCVTNKAFECVALLAPCKACGF